MPAAPPRSARSAAALRGWEKRRHDAKVYQRRTYKVRPYPDEEGDEGPAEPAEFAYGLYDAAHPLTGNPDEVARWRARLSPYFGQRVRLTLNGFRIDPATGQRRRIFIRRTRTVSGYEDFFGSGSLYGNALRVVRDRASTAELLVTSITVELADASGDDDEEGFE